MADFAAPISKAKIVAIYGYETGAGTSDCDRISDLEVTPERYEQQPYAEECTWLDPHLFGKQALVRDDYPYDGWHAPGAKEDA